MAIRDRLIKVTGISEDMAQKRLSDLSGQVNPGLAFFSEPGEVQIRITASSSEPEAAEKMASELAAKVKKRLSDLVFASGNEILEEVVAGLLIKSGFKVTVAESCTGGLIAARLTNVPGSSSYFPGGIVAYENEVKERLLGVSQDVLRKNGAVSRETAEAMARGVRNLLKSDLGMGVTGIAGPGGGTETKPVGLVFIALATPDSMNCRRFNFPGDRSGVRLGVSNAGLNMIRMYLES